MSQNIAKSVPPPQHHNQPSPSQSSKTIELFLTALIHNADLEFYLRVLQGISGMQPNHAFRRQIIFEGPRDRKLLGVAPPLMKQKNVASAQAWMSLHEPLARQAYYLTVMWDLVEGSFGRRTEEGEIEEGS